VIFIIEEFDGGEYHIVGYCNSEPDAVKYCSKGRIYSVTNYFGKDVHCAQYIYTPIPRVM